MLPVHNGAKLIMAVCTQVDNAVAGRVWTEFFRYQEMLVNGGIACIPANLAFHIRLVKCIKLQPFVNIAIKIFFVSSAIWILLRFCISGFLLIILDDQFSHNFLSKRPMLSSAPHLVPPSVMTFPRIVPFSITNSIALGSDNLGAVGLPGQIRNVSSPSITGLCM